jgi:hypothetical protein
MILACFHTTTTIPLSVTLLNLLFNFSDVSNRFLIYLKIRSIIQNVLNRPKMNFRLQVRN